MRIPRGRSRPIVETQLISLADIACLIIFFFMMTASFMRDKLVVDLPSLPQTGRTETPNSVVVDRHGKIYLNGDPVENAKGLENHLKALLENKKGKDLEIRLRCDKTLKYKEYGPVYNAIGAAGGTIAIIHNLRKS
jgi:biopolymer transport protein ExbD